jgi:ribonuclease P/MRP protein subunit RPP40
MKSSLKGRKKRVLFGGQFFDDFAVPSGVIQGSVLGPQLFNIFMSDLSNVVTSNLVLYADDSTLYRYIKSYEDEIVLQEDLNNIVL